MSSSIFYIELETVPKGFGFQVKEESDYGLLRMPSTVGLTIDVLKETVRAVAKDIASLHDYSKSYVLCRFAEWLICCPNELMPDIKNVGCVSNVCEKDDGEILHYSRWIDFQEGEADRELPDQCRALVAEVEDETIKLYLAVALCNAYYRGNGEHTRMSGEMLGIKGVQWIQAKAILTPGKDNCAEIAIESVNPTCMNVAFDRKMAALSGLIPFKAFGHSRGFDCDTNEKNDIPF